MYGPNLCSGRTKTLPDIENLDHEMRSVVVPTIKVSQSDRNPLRKLRVSQGPHGRQRRAISPSTGLYTIITHTLFAS